MIDIKGVADKADMIVSGYAFTVDNHMIKVLNLNNPDKAVVFSKDGEIQETSMDDIEIRIVLDYYENNREFLEVEDA